MSVVFKIGCDPELFVSNKEGKIVSAYGMVKGDKKNPLAMGNGAIQVDGMALEFNTKPASTYVMFNSYIREMIKILEDQLPEGHKLEAVPFAYFDPKYIKSQPPEATELGCDPDYNAWTGERNPRPNGDLPIRTASGHIHIGWTDGMDVNDPSHVEACRMMVKQLDCSLALISPLWDKDNTRRQLYGQLGSFRPKPYGVEYRVLSNAWIKHGGTIRMVYDTAFTAFRDLLDGNRYYENHAHAEHMIRLFSEGIFDRSYFSSVRKFVVYKMSDIPSSVKANLSMELFYGS